MVQFTVQFMVWFMICFMVQFMVWFIVQYRGTRGFYLNHVDQSLSLRLIECALHNVLLEHGKLPCVLSFDVHLDLGHLPYTQGYLGLLPEPCNPAQGF